MPQNTSVLQREAWCATPIQSRTLQPRSAPCRLSAVVKRGILHRYSRDCRWRLLTALCGRNRSATFARKGLAELELMFTDTLRTRLCGWFVLTLYPLCRGSRVGSRGAPQPTDSRLPPDLQRPSLRRASQTRRAFLTLSTLCFCLSLAVPANTAQWKASPNVPKLPISAS